MAKYKVGDRVRIVSEKPNHFAFATDMEEYLGKTLTVHRIVEGRARTCYEFDEARVGCFYWAFLEDWIAGLAEPMPEQRRGYDLKVVIRFSGNTTTARLMRGGTVVKTATARCNPKDQYSHAEGARVAMERLFAKKEEQS